MQPCNDQNSSDRHYKQKSAWACAWCSILSSGQFHFVFPNFPKIKSLNKSQYHVFCNQGKSNVSQCLAYGSLIESETTRLQLLSYGSCNHIIVPSVVEFKEAELRKCSFILQFFWGPFKYYVSRFLAFLNPPTHLCQHK